MIENEHSFLVETSVDDVWEYVENIPGWAAIFPGHQDCKLINADDSQWTIKVSAAGVTRTDRVQVHVEKWDKPQQVDFVFKVDDLPVEGNGSYKAAAVGQNQTQVTLKVCIIGSGPMAPMWEAVGTPMLPEFVKTFAHKLKAEIELAAGVGTESAADTGFAWPMFKGMVRSTWLVCATWFKGLFGIKPKAHKNKQGEGA
ncbi:SRPBCC family protein [Ketobacter sp.]|uniref:SRPBCC family protein n=1 Tax=Ketobacter sp. TaxID=2083498 RepID=UPI000F24BBAE|nr:SRPBCC family protein [Ketobacter sp.]RLT98715.1 MAG: SRPBCC family protein [Ketobacter sp.]